MKCLRQEIRSQLVKPGHFRQILHSAADGKFHRRSLAGAEGHVRRLTGNHAQHQRVDAACIKLPCGHHVQIDRNTALGRKALIAQLLDDLGILHAHGRPYVNHLIALNFLHTTHAIIILDKGQGEVIGHTLHPLQDGRGRRLHFRLRGGQAEPVDFQRLILQRRLPGCKAGLDARQLIDIALQKTHVLFNQRQTRRILAESALGCGNALGAGGQLIGDALQLHANLRQRFRQKRHGLEDIVIIIRVGVGACKHGQLQNHIGQGVVQRHDTPDQRVVFLQHHTHAQRVLPFRQMEQVRLTIPVAHHLQRIGAVRMEGVFLHFPEWHLPIQGDAAVNGQAIVILADPHAQLIKALLFDPEPPGRPLVALAKVKPAEGIQTLISVFIGRRGRVVADDPLDGGGAFPDDLILRLEQDRLPLLGILWQTGGIFRVGRYADRRGQAQIRQRHVAGEIVQNQLMGSRRHTETVGLAVVAGQIPQGSGLPARVNLLRGAHVIAKLIPRRLVRFPPYPGKRHGGSLTEECLAIPAEAASRILIAAFPGVIVVCQPIDAVLGHVNRVYQPLRTGGFPAIGHAPVHLGQRLDFKGQRNRLASVGLCARVIPGRPVLGIERILGNSVSKAAVLHLIGKLVAKAHGRRILLRPPAPCKAQKHHQSDPLRAPQTHSLHAHLSLLSLIV